VPAVVLYDSDCGFCVWAMSKVLAWDRARRLRPLALQHPEARTLLGGMDEERMMASWHLVAGDGSVLSAGRALAPLLRLLPGGRQPSGVLARLPRASDALYLAVAGRRTMFGRLVTTGARQRARRRVDSRERAAGTTG
jgi:predicted DCC family thiol-disulfide oxidoreductase YuxK